MKVIKVYLLWLVADWPFCVCGFVLSWWGSFLFYGNSSVFAIYFDCCLNETAFGFGMKAEDIFYLYASLLVDQSAVIVSIPCTEMLKGKNGAFLACREKKVSVLW